MMMVLISSMLRLESAKKKMTSLRGMMSKSLFTAMAPPDAHEFTFFARAYVGIRQYFRVCFRPYPIVLSTMTAAAPPPSYGV